LRLVVERLSKAYNFLWALRDFNVELESGDLVALLGPNGAGKTTLLKLLVGLITRTSGSIRFDGPSRIAPLFSRPRTGLLMPADHLYDNLTVRENLSFFLSLYGYRCDLQMIDDALEEVALLDRGTEFVGNLSSGMRCRVSLAKWKLLQPDLLLLDEPYGVLDGSGIDLLERFLRNLVENGGIVIMASHHVSRALKLCRRALILKQGRLIFNEVKRQPWPSFDRAFGEFLPQGEEWSS
jgi:ABC-type multidrug transport system ATPase subunit